MKTYAVRRASDSRQLDFFSFAPPIIQVDRGPPPVPEPVPLRIAPVLELPEIRLEPEPVRAVEPVVPKPRLFRITDADRLGEGSLRQKCENNLAAIELLKKLESEQRPATEAEQRTLVRYVGWGGLPQVFDAYNDDWKVHRHRLERLLTPDELASARATTLNAHYTSATIIGAMYAALARFGFGGGRILEPACGLGHFLGLMPEGIRNQSTFTGIEIDSLTARLAKTIYPESDIRHSPFEDAKLPDDFYDVVISNVPFGDYRPYDRRFQSWRFLIHDYFFAAALAKVRPGGIVALVTSRGTFDKQDTVLREFATGQADLIGAIRLPNDAFKRNANTEVTTDIVFLRKRHPDEPRSGPVWMELATVTNTKEENIPVNEFFAARPQLMLGEMQLTGRMYRQGEPSLVSNGRDLGEQLGEALEQLPQNVFRPLERKTKTEPTRVSLPSASEVKPNAFCLHNGQLARREGDSLVVLSDLAATTAQRLRGLISVRDSLRDCLRSQWQDHSEEELASARLRLNQNYDSFIRKFGPLSDRRNVSVFRGDPDQPLLLSVERFDRETGKASKAAIFRERTIAPKPVRRVTDAQSALLVSLSERGRVDPGFLSELLLQPFDRVQSELKGLVFLNPQTREFETDDAYLSGDVREKLRVAEAAVLVEPRFVENVAALRAVQPEDLPPSEIDARLGSAWVPEDVLGVFAEELLGEKGVEVRHAAVIGAWVVRGDWNVRGSVANTTEWGTDRRSALDLIEDALNLRVPTIYDPDPQAEKAVVNGSATEAAREKQHKLKERFQSWVWENDQRRERLCRIYNDQFNNLRLRTFNGDHLVLPGASSAVTLQPHQKAAVWRILQTPNTLLAHVVGAGKTFAMTAAAMELKRLGLARKPLFVVPNHMLEQFSSELLILYPAANLLVASKEDFEKQRRQTLMSRIATGTWDAVIVTHSGFERLPTSAATQRAFFEEQLAELSLALAEQRQAERGSRIVKELEKAKKRLETNLKELIANERKDGGLTFEELGVDRLFVDEAHIFKNLFYVSKMTRIAGLPQTASQRALDMFLKVRHIQQQGGGVVFATGTPIANSVVEMFTMQRYLQMGSLRNLGVAHFDAWAGTFGEPVTAMELSPDGAGYRLNTRFARFINVPELMSQFRQVADIQTASMLKLPIPELRGGRPTVIRALCSAELKHIVTELVARAERLRTGQVNPRDDNMLLVTTDGRKAALDLRIYDSSLPDHPFSKVNLAVAEVERVWRETTDQRSAQLVFCDLSTPSGKRDFNVYDDMRDKLVMKGIPEGEIAFIQDFDSDAAKAALFRDVRNGRVRILFGSTAKMGSGTNVQHRLIALHHLDAPWRPADVEQREGRILRQGNLNPEVRVYRYVTAESFDAYMWQCLETKAKFIAQVMTGDTSLRRLEDVDGAALTYAEVKAIASGNPLVIEKANVDAEVARLTRLRSQHVEANYRLRTQVRHMTDEVPRLERRAESLREDLLRRVDTRGDNFRIELGSETITDRGIAGELLNRLGERLKGLQSERRVGRFAGFELCAVGDFTGELQLALKGTVTHTARLQATAHGTTRALEHVVNHLDDTLAQTVDQIAQARKRLVDLKEQVDLPFEYGVRLSELISRQQELVVALDLTKNQAKGATDETVETTEAKQN